MSNNIDYICKHIPDTQSLLETFHVIAIQLTKHMDGFYTRAEISAALVETLKFCCPQLDDSCGGRRVPWLFKNSNANLAPLFTDISESKTYDVDRMEKVKSKAALRKAGSGALEAMSKVFLSRIDGSKATRSVTFFDDLWRIADFVFGRWYQDLGEADKAQSMSKLLSMGI